MVQINQDEPKTTKAIALLRSALGEVKKSRPDGISFLEAGQPCDRSIWYHLRWCTDPFLDGYVYREPDILRGQEQTICNAMNELKAIGCTVSDRDKHGERFKFEMVNGHLTGTMHGAVLGLAEAPKTWHVVEAFHTTETELAMIKKQGVKAVNPALHGRIQLLMMASSMKRALFYVTDDAGRLVTERIRYDATLAMDLIRRIDKAIGFNPCSTAELPGRICDHGGKRLDCTGCKFIGVCISQQVPAVSCRTCVSSTPHNEDGKWAWECELKNVGLTNSAQQTACDQHMFIPVTISFGEPVDGSTEDRYITYEKKNGTRFTNGPDHYTSNELTHVSHTVVGEGAVDAVKTAFPDAEVVESKQVKASNFFDAADTTSTGADHV